MFNKNIKKSISDKFRLIKGVRKGMNAGSHGLYGNNHITEDEMHERINKGAKDFAQRFGPVIEKLSKE